MLNRSGVAAAALLLQGLLGCSMPSTRIAPPSPASPNAAAPPASAALPTAGRYLIDSSVSEVRVLVYRAGPLSYLGHNHVMRSRQIEGEVTVGASFGASAIQLRIPADGFSVDDEEARHAEGPDFTAEVSPGAKQGTRDNMLGPRLLNASVYPDIVMHSVRIESGSVEFAVDIAGHASTIHVPMTLAAEGPKLSATGSVELRQSNLGLTPFSLLGGALQVQDAVRVNFDLVAFKP